ncbi:hypothetical protein ACJ65_04730 [Kocuria rhizophila]|nr:hypothetical protein ACJ65_04730 [Kocuria rhizophila]
MAPEGTDPVAPRRRLSRAQRHQQIRDTAASQALRVGIQQLTHRGIASAVGVTHALVVHYEPDMEALRAHVCGALLQEEFEHTKQHLEGVSDPVHGARTLIGLMSSPERAAHAAVWLDGWSLGRRHAGTAAVMRTMMRCWQELVSELVSRGVASGAFADVDARACAWEAIALLDGLNAHMLVGYGHRGEYAERIAVPWEARLGLAPGTLSAPSHTPDHHDQQ